MREGSEEEAVKQRKEGGKAEAKRESDQQWNKAQTRTHLTRGVEMFCHILFKNRRDFLNGFLFVFGFPKLSNAKL